VKIASRVAVGEFYEKLGKDTLFACTGYPDCKTTKQIGGTQKKPDVPLDEKCPVCGSNMVLKTGRFGEFTACGNYPACKHVKQKTIGMKCPDCNEGEVIGELPASLHDAAGGELIGSVLRRRTDVATTNNCRTS
jgi:hypothetical protein